MISAYIVRRQGHVADRIRRICVLDAGQIAEYDTPLNLYKMGGIFRGMCDRSSISLDDIRFAVKAREELEG